MGDPKGFMTHARQTAKKRSTTERITDWKELELPMAEPDLKAQGARCMDCGVPFCHSGCPLGNLIPEWNDAVYRGRWQDALASLHATNNFPEFTGRVCPAPCEASCVLGINELPVSIKQMEVAIIDRAFTEGWVRPEPPPVRTGNHIAVIGSGPAGLAAAAELNKAGHTVTVFERADRIGGLLRYGIPDFKLDKSVVQRRIDLLTAEGVNFQTNANVGVNVSVESIRSEFQAVCLAGGATKSRDLAIPGRELAGIHQAMHFLPQQNRRGAGLDVPETESVLATGKNVVVIGGGDTGSDCVGTSIRQGAKSVTQIEIMPKPPAARTDDFRWPKWPMILRTSSSHEEGCTRDWAINTKGFEGDGRVERMQCVRVEWTKGPDGRMTMQEVAGSEFVLPAEFVLLAMGFTGPEPDGCLKQFGVALDNRGNVATDAHMATTVPGIFSCGDMRRGQSLVVWAIAEGRRCAQEINRYLATL